MTDTSCIGEILKGNRDAFGILVDRYKDQAFNLAVKVLKDHDEANDCIQENK